MVPHFQGGEEQGRGSFALPQEQACVLVLAQGEQGPGWQRSGHVCIPQDKSLPHTVLHVQEAAEQRFMVGEDLPQWQDVFTVCGQGGHAPILCKLNNLDRTRCKWLVYNEKFKISK